MDIFGPTLTLFSRTAATIQLKRKLGFTDSIVYEKSGDIGGTWNHNRYPGAACDIPLSLYSYSVSSSTTARVSKLPR